MASSSRESAPMRTSSTIMSTMMAIGIRIARKMAPSMAAS
jgi:hypothetical protein